MKQKMRLILLFCGFVSFSAYAGEPRDDELIKNAIVMNLVAAASHPDLMSDPMFAMGLMATQQLVQLFDAMNSPESRDTLASLAAYHLHEQIAKRYACVVARKGDAMKATLERLLSQPENECLKQWGKYNPKPSGVEISVCLPKDAYISHLERLIGSLGKKSACP